MKRCQCTTALLYHTIRNTTALGINRNLNIPIKACMGLKTPKYYKEQHYDDDQDLDCKPPARPNRNNFVNLVVQQDEARQQEQQEQQILDHSHHVENKIHGFQTTQQEQ
jgi:hypothetical protein